MENVIDFEQAKAAIASQKTAAPPQTITTTIMISGELESGEKVSMDVPITHPFGVPEPGIILAAFNKFKEIGGIVVSTTPDALDFYLAVNFKKLHFEAKKILVI